MISFDVNDVLLFDYQTEKNLLILASVHDFKQRNRI